MRYLGIIFHRSIPFYVWMIVLYTIFVTVVAMMPAAEATADAAKKAASCVIAGEQLYQRVESALSCRIVTIPLFSSASFVINWTIVFILFGFVSAWIEVVRATNVRDTARNDTWSLVVTIIAFILFVGVSVFGTTAFMIVAVVGFGDVLLDRYVGQAVARRDFGGVIPGGGH
ncbi:MAG: hypothetical protein MRY74_14040 [Neomegalonema sp.]|nr:hypothetical protein [Neomegalonema sp.]